MKLLLDEDKVKLILERNKEYIGGKKLDGIDTLIAGVIFTISVFLADYSKFKWMMTVSIVLAIFYVAYGVYQVHRSAKTSKINSDKLYELLEEANEMEKSQHSIVIIKDDFNKNSNRFLVYDDPGWKCRLFINYHTITDGLKENMDNIRVHLKQELKTDTDEGSYLFECIHKKYSPTANKEKTYLHKFYRFSLETTDEIKHDDFVIDGKHYYWMSLAEMKADERIMERNKDVIRDVEMKL